MPPIRSLCSKPRKIAGADARYSQKKPAQRKARIIQLTSSTRLYNLLKYIIFYSPATPTRWFPALLSICFPARFSPPWVEIPSLQARKTYAAVFSELLRPITNACGSPRHVAGGGGAPALSSVLRTQACVECPLEALTAKPQPPPGVQLRTDRSAGARHRGPCWASQRSFAFLHAGTIQ